MSFIPEGYGEIVTTYAQVGTIRPAQWTIGVRPGGGLSPDEYLDLVIGEWDDVNGVLNAATYDVSLSLVSVVMTVQTSTGPVIYSRPISRVGTRAGEAQPPNVAALFRRTTDRGGRRGRGRLYLPSGYLSEADVVEGGNIITTRRNELQALATGLRTACFQGVDGLAVLLHNDGVVAPDEMTALTVQQLVATMRRRLRK